MAFAEHQSLFSVWIGISPFQCRGRKNLGDNTSRTAALIINLVGILSAVPPSLRRISAEIGGERRRPKRMQSTEINVPQKQMPSRPTQAPCIFTSAEDMRLMDHLFMFHSFLQQLLSRPKIGMYLANCYGRQSSVIFSMVPDLGHGSLQSEKTREG